MKNKKPSETISRGVVGEVIVLLTLPPALLRLSRDWEKLTYEQKIADAKKRSLKDRLLFLQSLGGICKNAIQLVREFRPLIEVCRDELSQLGRRVPIDGRPTWTEFIPATFGFSARRMQQLLAGRSPSCESRQPKPARPNITTVVADPNEQIVVLAVKLARSVFEQGLADKFPDADEILRIVDSKGKLRLSALGSRENGHDVLSPQGRKHTTSPNPEQTAPVKGVAELSQLTGYKFQIQPDCYVCGTGVGICAVHNPHLKALMEARGIGEFDASEILAQRFAKESHKIA